MNDLFKVILSLSMSASMLIIMLLAFRPLLRNRLSKAIQYFLWIVVLLRLIIPISFQDNISNSIIFDDVNRSTLELESNEIRSEKLDDGHESDYLSKEYKVLSNKNTILESDGDRSFNYIGLLLDFITENVAYIWIVGMLVTLKQNVAEYISFKTMLRRGNLSPKKTDLDLLYDMTNGRDVKLLRNKYIGVPMIIGLINPYIVIPDIEFDEVQLRNILLHELTHLKHNDIFVKWITMFAVSLHWFNPLVHIFKKEINNACELACDEKVIRNFTAREKQNYGDALISFAEGNNYSLSILQATMCEEKRSLKERLIAIMKYERKSKFNIIVSVALVLGVVITALYFGGGLNNSVASNLDQVDEGSAKNEVVLVQTGVKTIDECVPEGWSVLEYGDNEPQVVFGDLNQDSIDDAVLVLEKNIEDEAGNPRQLLFLFGTAENGFKQKALADSVILNSKQGGGFGDPYDGISIVDGVVQVNFWGGSNSKWSQSYQYEYIEGDFFLIGAKLGDYTNQVNEDEEVVLEINERTYNFIEGIVTYSESVDSEADGINSTTKQSNLENSSLIGVEDFNIETFMENFSF